MTEEYDKKFKDILDELWVLRTAKTNDYGEVWRETGQDGIFIKIYIKLGRLKQLLWSGKTAQNEPIRDTFIDIAAYGIYGVICCDEGNVHGMGGMEMSEETIDKIRAIIEGSNQS